MTSVAAPHLPAGTSQDCDAGRRLNRSNIDTCGEHVQRSFMKEELPLIPSSYPEADWFIALVYGAKGMFEL